MDISSLLAAAIQGHPWSGSALVLIGVVGYVLTHIFPLLPKPADNAGGIYPMLYAGWSFLAGNWGGQKGSPVTPPTPVGPTA